MRKMTTLFSISLLWSCRGAVMATDPDMFWFQNESQCGDTKGVVRSYCEIVALASRKRNKI